jgi:hypothetical protein
MKLKRLPVESPPSTLIDAVMDGYIDWREESTAVEAAYRDWHAARREEEALAFITYCAALDREEDAAERYRRLIEQVVGHLQL